MSSSNFIPKALIPDPHNVDLFLSVNKKPRQFGNTNQMIFKIPQLISIITEAMTLEKGDIIMTGTPKGVGEVVNGDVMTAGVKVSGQSVTEGNIEVEVKEREGRYTFAT